MAATDTDIHKVHAVLLAAGASRRFGEDNKLLAELGGAPLVRRVAERLLASRLAGVRVVTGFEGERLRGVLAGLDLNFTENPDFAEGLASSLRRGIGALPEGVSGAMIVLADMPGVTTELIDQLLATYQQEACNKIIYPERGGVQGNPVIWPAHYFEQLTSLTGDAGAKRLLGKHAAETLGVPLESGDVLRDIDEPGDLAAWRDDGQS